MKKLYIMTLGRLAEYCRLRVGTYADYKIDSSMLAFIEYLVEMTHSIGNLTLLAISYECVVWMHTHACFYKRLIWYHNSGGYPYHASDCCKRDKFLLQGGSIQ